MNKTGDPTQTISAQQALIYVMMTMAAVDGRIGDIQLKRIGRLVQTLPVFEKFDPERLTHVAQECGEILQVEGGLDAVLGLIGKALPAHLCDTAYALGVEIAVADYQIAREEIRFLARLRDTLRLDKLTTAAIEKAAIARYQTA